MSPKGVSGNNGLMFDSPEYGISISPAIRSQAASKSGDAQDRRVLNFFSNIRWAISWAIVNL
jgi:hypothetical protein